MYFTFTCDGVPTGAAEYEAFGLSRPAAWPAAR